MITAKSLKTQLDGQTFYHPGGCQPDYGKFTRYIYFRGELLHIHVSEIKQSKWFQKAPKYRPVGKSTYNVEIVEYASSSTPPSRIDNVLCDKLVDVAMILNAYDLEQHA